MKKSGKLTMVGVTVLIMALFTFALFKSSMSVEQMTDIFDKTKGIGSKLAPSIANDIHQKYFLFNKNIFILIGSFIGILTVCQFAIMRSIMNGQVENFELHHGTRLELGNKISLLEKMKKEAND